MGISKDLLREALAALNLPETARSESLSMKELSEISNYLVEKGGK
jgi:hypothetical protein